MSKYFQCSLSQGTGRTQAFIEEKGAIVGALVEIKSDEFHGLWRVDAVGDIGVDEEKVKAKQVMNRNAHPSLENA